MRTLNRPQTSQKRRRHVGDFGSLMQVRISGMHGRRNRGSWCGITLRIRVPVIAAVRRELCSMVSMLKLERLKGYGIKRRRAGPRS